MKLQTDFEDLANSTVFQDFCAIVSALTGVRICLVNASNPKQCKFPVSPPQDNPLCAAIQATAEGKRACDACDLRHLEQASKRETGFAYECHAGLVDLVVPVFVEGVHMATINGGQVLSHPPSDEGFQALLRRLDALGLDPEALRPLYFQTLFLTPEKLDQTLKLLSFFSNYFCEVGSRLNAAAPGERVEIDRAKEYIRVHFREPLRLGDVARRAYLSPAYFSHVFRQTTTACFSEYLQQVRIAESAKLLRTTEHSITEIACSVGFNNISHFNRVFRKLVGCSPSQYRACSATNESYRPLALSQK
ncbi:MAG: PocR ligand-binding domain-containing protein [Acidobacteriota bacterium]